MSLTVDAGTAGPGLVARGSQPSLPRLNTASEQNVILAPLVTYVKLPVVCREYSSGAVYCGSTCGNRRYGHGVFTWPSGARYEGEYADNARNGAGSRCRQYINLQNLSPT